MTYTPTAFDFSNPDFNFMQRYGNSSARNRQNANAVNAGNQVGNFDTGVTKHGGNTPTTGGPPTTGPRFSETMGNISSGVSAFGTLAELYLGFKAMSAQKKQFNFQKQAWEKNYANSLKDYDNQLLDQYSRQSQGQAYFGNTNFQSLDSYMGQRSLGGYGNSGSTGSTLAPPTAAAAPVAQRPPQTNQPMFDRRLLGG